MEGARIALAHNGGGNIGTDAAAKKLQKKMRELAAEKGMIRSVA